VDRYRQSPLLIADTARRWRYERQATLSSALGPGCFPRGTLLVFQISCDRAWISTGGPLAAVGNPDRREYIETIHRRGYRFIAVVKVMEVLDSGKAFASDKSGVRDGIQSLQKSRATRSNAAKPIARIDSQDACASRTFIKCYTESEEAQHLYVRGRWYWNKYTVEGLTKGIDHFRDAIKIDPKYALAYAGLADCYYRLSNIHLHPKEAMPKAETAAVNALLIDERLAEAHALLGLIRMFYDRDWPAAETEFRRSIELAPDCALVHKRYGWALGMLGNFDKAITEMKQALSLAPTTLELAPHSGHSSQLFLGAYGGDEIDL
jgi:hypothetical protein